MVEKENQNRKAVIALTLGILSIFVPGFGIVIGVIGIIISIAAKREIERTNEEGISYANAGLICSVIGIVAQLFLVLIGIISFLNVPAA
ncbi:DUF4190 domain-containing protein [Anaerobacillus sp. CMMVII]|uniref:DUF4190 domain-containing protein n=1 Tax=Anaerobacillus sp. CMMVII TaxID=2755588 RepID=UPI0021B7219C|nr:DUF4190 domain-containing protein [Anaerobacillus sp. CMMVII]MCT8136691.1 DUF4190 domain-containing protein [Anaerobacillus sp. CMMVII]